MARLRPASELVVVETFFLIVLGIALRANLVQTWLLFTHGQDLQPLGASSSGKRRAAGLCWPIAIMENVAPKLLSVINLSWIISQPKNNKN